MLSKVLIIDDYREFAERLSSLISMESETQVVWFSCWEDLTDYCEANKLSSYEFLLQLDSMLLDHNLDARITATLDGRQIYKLIKAEVPEFLTRVYGISSEHDQRIYVGNDKYLGSDLIEIANAVRAELGINEARLSVR